MKEFQKIAIGLLGLTHPEIFIPRPKPDAVSLTKSWAALRRASTRLMRRATNGHQPAPARYHSQADS
jgi:hypothetical protein